MLHIIIYYIITRSLSYYTIPCPFRCAAYLGEEKRIVHCSSSELSSYMSSWICDFKFNILSLNLAKLSSSFPAPLLLKESLLPSPVVAVVCAFRSSPHGLCCDIILFNFFDTILLMAPAKTTHKNRTVVSDWSQRRRRFLTTPRTLFFRTI